MRRAGMSGGARQEAYLEYGPHALPFGVADGSEPVSSHGTGHKSGHVGDDEPQRTSAYTAQKTPELVRRPASGLVGHALFLHHFLEDIAELGVTLLLPAFGAAIRAGMTALVREVVPSPRVGARHGATAAGRRHLLLRVGEGVGVRGRALEELALGIIVAASGRVGECIIGIIDKLELAGAFGSVW